MPLHRHHARPVYDGYISSKVLSGGSERRSHVLAYMICDIYVCDTISQSISNVLDVTLPHHSYALTCCRLHSHYRCLYA